MSKKIKKRKLALLALAGSAFVASLLYDKNQKNKKDMTTYQISIIALGVVLNVLGALLALTLRLPIYLDSIGTIFIACLLGPKYGVLTGILGSFVSGITFD